MAESVFISIVITGFTVAFAHAALPTHWLPFVLAGRGQGWQRPKTLWVTALASLGHVLFTTVLGVLVVFLGISVESWLGGAFPLIVGGILISFGLFYLLRQRLSGAGHHHWRLPFMKQHSHSGGCGEEGFVRDRSDATVIFGLLSLLTFSPCEGFLPVYLSGIKYGWTGFVVLSVVLAVATMAGMVFFTWLMLSGLEKIRLDTLEKYESGILGVLLMALGLVVIAFEYL